MNLEVMQLKSFLIANILIVGQLFVLSDYLSIFVSD